MVYFVKHEQMTLKQAYLHIHKKRPIICPNAGFWRQMIDFEKKITGQESSVKMLKGRYRREVPDVYFHRNDNQEE